MREGIGEGIGLERMIEEGGEIDGKCWEYKNSTAMNESWERRESGMVTVRLQELPESEKVHVFEWQAENDRVVPIPEE